MKLGELIWTIVDQDGEVCGDMECSCIYSDEPDECEVADIQKYYGDVRPGCTVRAVRVRLMEVKDD